jgi:hypothetical protein
VAGYAPAGGNVLISAIMSPADRTKVVLLAALTTGVRRLAPLPVSERYWRVGVLGVQPLQRPLDRPDRHEWMVEPLSRCDSASARVDDAANERNNPYCFGAYH